MLRHKTLAITADTYTSVIPEVARAAAAAVHIVPRRIGPKGPSAADSISLASRAKKKASHSPRRKKDQPSTDRMRRQGLETRTRGLRVCCSDIFFRKLESPECCDMQSCTATPRGKVT
jgi:hypothetical protein